MNRRLGTSGRIFLSATLIASIGILPGAGTATSAPGDNPCWTFKTSEKRFARMINAERVKHIGLGKLKLDPELSRVAKKQSKAMANEGDIFHSPSDRLRTRITNWTTLGENVGVGSTVESLHRAFMNSPPHKANVLGASYMNIGVHVTRRSGRIWVVMIFEGIANPGTTYKMPTC
jgi:uncharacterized protein YkwD